MSRASKTIRIMLVDDHTLFRKGLKLILEASMDIRIIEEAIDGEEAIRKAIQDAKKHVIEVPLVGTTVPHEITGIYGAGRVLLKPSQEGTGVIAGGAVRAVCELVGIRDIRTKSLGSKNPRNVVNATMEALKGLKRAEDVARLRGLTVEEILG